MSTTRLLGIEFRFKREIIKGRLSVDIKSQQLRLPLEPQEGCLTCFAKGKIMIVFVVSMYSLEFPLFLPSKVHTISGTHLPPLLLSQNISAEKCL